VKPRGKSFLSIGLTLAVVLIIGGLGLWAYREGRHERALERERERPIHVPPRLRHLAHGEVAVALDPATQGLAGIEVARGIATSQGVEIPVSSILHYQEDLWVYVESNQGLFVRRPIKRVQSTSHGWIVKGLPARAQIVTTGAQLLFSEELKHEIKLVGEGEGR